MKIEITIPTLEEVLRLGFDVPVAPRGTKWKSSRLRSGANLTGVYVIHHGGGVKYIGKTNAPRMSFARRVREHFCEASGGHIYSKVAALSVPPVVRVSLFSLDAIDKLVKVHDGYFGPLQKSEVFETAMIMALNPIFQSHHVDRLVAVLSDSTPKQLQWLTAQLAEIQQKDGTTKQG